MLKEYSLNATQQAFLCEHFDEVKNGTLTLDKDERDKLLDNLTDLFLAEGTNSNGEPNEIGHIIEGLIDLLTR